MTSSPVRSGAGRLFLGIGALGILLAIVGLLLPVVWNGAAAGDTQRQSIQQAAETFAVAYNTYDSNDVEDYQKRVRGSLTDEYEKNFVEITEAGFPVLAKDKIISKDARVLAVGVSDLKEKSATVLVALNAQVSSKNTEASVEHHFRWALKVLKVDGKWLVDSVQNLPNTRAEETPAPEGEEK